MIQKKIAAIIIAIMMLSSLPALVSADQEEDDVLKTSQSLIFETPTLQQTDEGLLISTESQTGVVMMPGTPQLPVTTALFTLPFGSEIADVTVLFKGENDMTLNDVVMPAPTFSYVGDDRMEPQYIQNENAYEVDLSPIESFTYTIGAGIQDGEHVLFVAVECHPVRYQPKSDLLTWNTSAEIQVEYHLAAEPMVFPDDCDLLIITPTKFANTLDRLVTHKESVGIRTKVVTLDDIENTNTLGVDEVENIKYRIKDEIETTGIENVLIIGDCFQTPMRYAYASWGGYGDTPTDLYYADIYDGYSNFCTWNSDGDNKYAEYTHEQGCTDGQDLYADVYIGRLPCKTRFDLNIMIGKIINYETTAYGSNWVNRMLLMGGDTFPYHGPLEGELVTGEIEDIMTDFDITKLWLSEGTYSPFSVNMAWSKGVGFVSYSGHGYMHGWGTSEPDVEQRIEYYTPYILGMLNGRKLPIVFFDACSTGHFDYLFNGVSVSSIACILLMLPFGGAVGTVGSTRVAYTSVSSSGIHGGAGYLNLRFFHAYHPGTTFGEMLCSSQNDYITNVYRDCLTLEEFTLFGDPTLHIGGYAN